MKEGETRTPKQAQSWRKQFATPPEETVTLPPFRGNIKLLAILEIAIERTGDSKAGLMRGAIKLLAKKFKISETEISAKVQQIKARK